MKERKKPKTVVIPVGDEVVCDLCNKDYTLIGVTGEFILGSYAYCPMCAVRYKTTAKKMIHCPSWESFADFVRRVRGPDACIRIGPITKKKTKGTK